MIDVTSSRAGLREPLLAFAAATVLAAGLAQLGAVVPFVRDNLHVAIAVIFFYAPQAAARLSGRPFDYGSAGLRLDPVRLNLAVLGAALAVTFPAFVVGFFGFYGAVCARHGDWLARSFAPMCVRWQGWRGGALTLPPSFLLLALNQLIVVAIPEELFFRGYLLGRLEERWPSRRRLFGAPVGAALLVSSLLFAVGHLVVVPNPQRLAVFFPALVFGWMRARTGSIAAGAAFHALCNLFSDVLHTSFFR
ncbi:MAG TPA: CPBP family intramembrane glutamic endopeptidase [Polyangia bacterium]|nr:CPBP family intramembrane glutamic endopeptidase [Polyangia bacterium]